ncbi:hypothetical protein D3C71_1655700 [compost metagenome]
MIVDQETEHFQRVAPVDIERPVQELDRPRPVRDQVQNIRLHPLDIVIAHAHLNARQAELAVERTAAARLEIDDSFA